ncbi:MULTISPECIES: E2/UBC family protein [Deinococcus]|uniref:E2/UBC family protein n=1 Tax=Deinococcus TaxID=1298 RepID=UPI001665EFD0|nr:MULTISPECIES: E2/UBC family protein [Deinococcus]MDK2014576.1 hypothetical protein [Deinococcus sp. 43]GGB79794.1 hypothetical protein GCM10008019_40060 [Deinococcus soli (ex Cha et al. 2016)]
MTALAQLEATLKAQGFTTEAVMTAGGQSFVLLRGFPVTSGRFEGRVIDLGLEVQPNALPGSALHVHADPPLLRPGSHPQGYNIMENQSALGPTWQYWSFNLAAALQSGASLSSIINGVLNRA